MIKNARGNYTEQQVLRCAQMSGPFGKQLDNMFTSVGLVDMRSLPSRKRDNVYHSDIKRFVEDYKAEALCDYLPVRSHRAFDEYVASNRITAAAGLGQKLKSMSKRLDIWKNISRHEVVSGE